MFQSYNKCFHNNHVVTDDLIFSFLNVIRRRKTNLKNNWRHKGNWNAENCARILRACLMVSDTFDLVRGRLQE